jgi:hypothetical protein
VKIPSLNLSYDKPKASAEVARRVPELVLKSRRGWTGPPLPFDTDEAAIAWGMKDLNLKGVKAKYRNSKRSVRELRTQLSTAVNKDPEFRKANPIPRVREKGRFTKRPEIPLAFPALSSDSPEFTMSESGSEGRHARRMAALV